MLYVCLHFPFVALLVVDAALLQGKNKPIATGRKAIDSNNLQLINAYNSGGRKCKLPVKLLLQTIRKIML